MKQRCTYNLWLSLLCLAGILSMVLPREAAAEIPDSKGKDFFLTFLPNEHTAALLDLEDTDSLYIVVSATEIPTHGTINYRDASGNITTVPFAITSPPGTYTFAKFWETCELETVSSAQIRPQSFHIETDKDVTVCALNHALTSSDATLVFPTDVLGTQYRVLAYPSDLSYGTPSQCAVVATRNNTTVTFTLSTPIAGRQDNTFTVTLQKGDVYVIQARLSPLFSGDLTGTLVESSQPIALFAGHLRTMLPLSAERANSRDHLLEQIPPLSTWGSSYLLTPFPRPPSLPLVDVYDLVRVLAAYDNTEVVIDGKLHAQLNAGEVYELPLREASLLMASNAILVAQYKHTSSEQPTLIGSGDPFMLIVPSRSQFLSSYQSVSVQATIQDYLSDKQAYPYQYCTVICQTGDIRSVRIDEQAVSPTLFKRISSTCYSYAWIPLTDGAHSVRAANPFGMYMYGYGSMDSYGYNAGMAFTTFKEQPMTVSGDTIICTGKSVQLHATGGLSYHWSPPDGLSCTDCPNPIAKPDIPTHYTLRMDDDLGCIFNFPVFVDVQPYPVANLDSTVTTCPGKDIVLHASGGKFYTWSPTDRLSCTDCANPVASPLSTTVYSVVISNGANCLTIDSIKVVVEPFTPTGMPDDTLMCAKDFIVFDLPDEYSYHWFPPTGLSCDTCAHLVARPEKTTKYTVVVINAQGCRFTKILTITVDSPIASVSPDISLCEDAPPIRLLAKGGNFYQWSPSDGLSCTDCASPLAKPERTTTYTVRVSINASCETVTTVTVSVLPAPQPVLSLDTTICPNTLVQLSASGGTLYNWTPAQTLSCRDCPEPVASPLETTIYYVAVTNDEGCTVVDSVHVTVKRPADIFVVTTTTICAGDTILLTASGGTSYHWTPSDGLSCTNCTNPLASPQQTTVYTLTINGENDCPEQRNVTVRVLPRPELTMRADTTICRGGEALLHTEGNGTYSWSPATGLSCINCASPIAKPSVSTRYYATVNNGLCSRTDSVLVSIRPCGLDATLSGVDFGAFALCDTVNKQCTLINTGLEPIEITGWQITGTDAESFDVELPDVTLPFTLAVGDSLHFSIVCHPRQEGSLLATFVVQTQDKDYTISAPYTAIGIRGKMVFTLGSNLQTAPGTKLRLDIQAQSDQWPVLHIDSLELIISYKSTWMRYAGEIVRGPASDNSSLFAAHEENRFDGSHAIIITAGGNRPFFTNGTIATVTVEPLLASELIYTPTFEVRAVGRETCVEIQSYSPTFDISFCADQLRPVRTGLEYTFEVLNGSVVSTEYIRLHYTIALQADARIELYNQLGELVTQEYQSDTQPGQYDKLFNISRLATGMYMIRFSSGPFSKSIPLLVGTE